MKTFNKTTKIFDNISNTIMPIVKIIGIIEITMVLNILDVTIAFFTKLSKILD